MRKTLVRIAMVTLALAAPLQGLAQSAKGAAEPLGMVIDVQGKGTITDAGKKTPLEMLAYLKPAAEIQLEAGASMTVTWYEGAKEMKFSGPAKLKVAAKGIEVASGKPAQERAVSDEKVEATRKLPPRLGQAAISMRGLKPMTPEQEAKREKLRPAENAPVADWVTYAMGLEQMGLTSEAKGVWKKLSEQRPDDPKLKELAK